MFNTKKKKEERRRKKGVKVKENMTSEGKGEKKERAKIWHRIFSRNKIFGSMDFTLSL